MSARDGGPHLDQPIDHPVDVLLDRNGHVR
jgi:hypothetical protein